MRGLRDKIAIVAGAAPGNIGGATAFRLAQEGMKVTAADLNEAGARAVAGQVCGRTSRGQSIRYHPRSLVRATDRLHCQRVWGAGRVVQRRSQSLGADYRQGYYVITVPLDVWQHIIGVTLTRCM